MSTIKIPERHPFLPNLPFLIPPETSEIIWLSDVSGGIKRKHWEGNSENISDQYSFLIPPENIRKPLIF